MDAYEDSDGLKSDINVTPLVDVMLVVLIIFMLVTPLLQPGVAVELPRATNVHGVSDEPDRSITVVIKASGELFVGNDAVLASQLIETLQHERAANRSRGLLIKADRNVPYGQVRRAFAAGREAGFESASLVADQIEVEGGE